MKPFAISQGNLTTITDTILADCAPVDLTGATVTLVYQGPGLNNTVAATIISPPANGQVKYQFVSPQTEVAGDYAGQWVVTDALGNVTSYPAQPFQFQIIPALPISLPSGITRLAELYDDVRAVSGDFEKNLYQDTQIASVMRVILRQGKVVESCRAQRFALAPDAQTITPAIGPTDFEAYASLVYNAALILVSPNTMAYSYRTRAMSERFGEARDFLAELKLALYEIENGGQAYGNVYGLRSSLFAVNGIFVWSYLQAAQSIDLSYRS